MGFPFVAFEEAVLSMLREIDLREILGVPDDRGGRVLALTGKVAEYQARADKLRTKLIEGDDTDPVADALREVVARLNAATEQLDRARSEAASPLADAWGECRSLADALKGAGDPTAVRIRLRAAIRRIVAGIHAMFVAKGIRRVGAVQVWFTTGTHRDYLIVYTPNHSPGGKSSLRQGWAVRSFAAPAGVGDLDLRNPDHARQLEAVLAGMDFTAESVDPKPKRPGPTKGKRG